MGIIYHADDYAASEEASRNILDCKERGKLRSISILTNGSSFDANMQLLEDYEKKLGSEEKLLKSIHFNLAEGPALSCKEGETSLIYNAKGMLETSFFKILIWSYTGKRKLLEAQISREMGAQIDRIMPYLKVKDQKYCARVDSHQHYHMIPLVLRCILKELSARNIEIEFIRIPAEPLIPFLVKPSLWFSYRPINLVKNLVLNTLNIMDLSLLKPYRTKSAVFFGIMMSGGMDRHRVSVLAPEFEKIADRKKLPLEILCHPGGVSDISQLMDPDNADCKEFYMSQGRNTEKEMLLS